MINNIRGYRSAVGGNDTLLFLSDGHKKVCNIQTRKPSDAFLIAAIVTASIEIDEITKQDNSAHE